MAATDLRPRCHPLGKYVLPLVLTLALLLRVYLLFTVLEPIEGDEAVIGLMAQHIRHGARTLFDYDISYHGPLESYLTAPLFALFGMNRFVLRIVPLAFSLAFIWAIYGLGSKLYGRGVGLYSALYAAIPPSMLIIWGLKAGAGYIVVLVLGTVSLSLALDLRVRASPAKIVVLSLVLALGLWVQYVTGYYVAALILVMASAKILRVGPEHPLPGPAKALAVVLMVGVLLGVYGLLSRLAALPPLADFLRNLVGLFTTALPVLLGFLQPSVSDALFTSQVTKQGLFYILAVALTVAACLAVVGIGAQRLKEGDNLLLLFGAVTVIAFSLFFTVFRLPFALLQEPRYLLPLYSAIPLAVFALFLLLRRLVWLRPVLLAGLLAFNLHGNLTIQPALNLPYLHSTTVADNRVLIDWLDDNDIRHVYTDYWIGYPLTFESEERIVPFIIASGSQVGWNRYPPYAAEVESSARPAYIFVAGSTDEQTFARYLIGQNVAYQVQSLAPYVVYWNLSIPVRFPLRPPPDAAMLHDRQF